MTADAVAESLRRTPGFAKHAAVSVHGNRIFFKLAQRTARFDLVLANPQYPVIRETPKGFFGTGPYCLAPDTRPDVLRMVRNPHYDGPAHADEIHVRVLPPDDQGHPKALIGAINRGEIDFASHLSRDELNQVQAVRRVIEGGFCTACLFFNTERPMFQDPRLRRALAFAVDRHAVAEASFNNALAFTATGLLPPSLGAVPDGLSHDPERAQALFKAVGLTPSQTVRLHAMGLQRPYLPRPRATADAVAKCLGAVGLKVEVKLASTMQEFLERSALGDYDLAISGWVPETPDPLDFLEGLLASWSIPGPRLSVAGGANLARWRSEEMDRALREHRAQGRPETLSRIHALFHTALPLVPLQYGPRIAAVSWRLAQRPVGYDWRPFLAEIPIST